MRRVLIVQPVLTSYRVPLFDAMPNELIEIHVYAELSKGYGCDVNTLASSKFHFVRSKWRRFGCFRFPRLSFYSEYFGADILLHFADFKYFSLIFSLFVSRAFNKPIFLHGQGGVKSSGGVFAKVVYNLAVLLSSGYIAYTEYSANHLRELLLPALKKKVSVADNTLYLPCQNSFEPTSKDLFFVGRLRDSNGIELLLSAALERGVQVHVVGDGESHFIKSLLERFSNLSYHGAIFDICDHIPIAKKCMAGVYAGDAGLSVVHYMSLGLPVVVHSDVSRHMGPEPSYIIDGFNGLLFERGNKESLSLCLARLTTDAALRTRLSKGALNTFSKLNTPPMHEKFMNIMGLK